MASDIRALVESIEASYMAAKRGLVGTAMVARHDFIQKKIEEIDNYFAELQHHMGEIPAAQLIISTLELAETKYELEQERLVLAGKEVQ